MIIKANTDLRKMFQGWSMGQPVFLLHLLKWVFRQLRGPQIQGGAGSLFPVLPLVTYCLREFICSPQEFFLYASQMYCLHFAVGLCVVSVSGFGKDDCMCMCVVGDLRVLHPSPEEQLHEKCDWVISVWIPVPALIHLWWWDFESVI